MMGRSPHATRDQNSAECSTVFDCVTNRTDLAVGSHDDTNSHIQADH